MLLNFKFFNDYLNIESNSKYVVFDYIRGEEDFGLGFLSNYSLT